MALNEKTELTEERKEEVKEKIAQQIDKAKEVQAERLPTGDEAPSTVERAEAAVKAMEKQNKLMEDNIKRAEKLAAETLLGGKSTAGSEPTHEDQVTAEARKILKGTGYDEDLFPSKKKQL